MPRISGGCLDCHEPRATASTAGWSGPYCQKSAASTSSAFVPWSSAAVIAPSTRQASTGRDAGCVVRLDSPDRSAASAMSVCQRIGTAASRISDPLAALSSSGWRSVTSPVRSNRLSAPIVVLPMSKHVPVDDQ